MEFIFSIDQTFCTHVHTDTHACTHIHTHATHTHTHTHTHIHTHTPLYIFGNRDKKWSLNKCTSVMKKKT